MVSVVKADFDDAKHASDITMLLDMYAQDSSGGGTPLSDEIKANLVVGMKRIPGAVTYLAYKEDGTTAVGLATCFEGFSTFTAKPTFTVHDIFVETESRGKGICKQILAEVEKEAEARGCCRVTMEILSGQRPGVGLGLSQFLLAGRTPIPAGFSQHLLNSGYSGAIHMDKKITK